MLIGDEDSVVEFHYEIQLCKKHSFKDAKMFKSEKSSSNYCEKCVYIANQIANQGPDQGN